MNLLPELFAIDRRLALAHERLVQQFPEDVLLLSTIDNYLACYADYYHLSVPQIREAHDRFARVYTHHLKIFSEGGQYPCQYGDYTTVDRQAYDIALILSCALSAPRLQILRHLEQLAGAWQPKSLCVIGVGAGIELEILTARAHGCEVVACDLTLGDFVRERFSSCTLVEHPFAECRRGRQFDAIVAIELLEHLSQPLLLLGEVHEALPAGGRLVCTTATNMPQFDHLTNFTDIPGFQRDMLAMGFRVLTHKEFSQKYVFENVEARNDWFVLEKS